MGDPSWCRHNICRHLVRVTICNRTSPIAHAVRLDEIDSGYDLAGNTGACVHACYALVEYAAAPSLRTVQILGVQVDEEVNEVIRVNHLLTNMRSPWIIKMKSN